MTVIQLQGTGRYRVQLDVSIHEAQAVAPNLTIDLEPAPAGAQELTISAMIWCGKREDSAGQCIDRVIELTRGHAKAAVVDRLCVLWRRWHLAGMNAGTRAQREALADLPPPLPPTHYAGACAHLETKGLLVDRGYKYGAAWLLEPLPADVAAEVDALVAELAAT